MNFCTLCDVVTYVFDPLHDYWESVQTQRKLTGILILIFLLALLGIELDRWGVLPQSVSAYIPASHYQAVNVAFTLVLVMEVLSLIFALPSSFSSSVGKQFEILSLILLRDAFKELVHFPEPLKIGWDLSAVWPIVGSSVAAVLIFALLGVFTNLQRHTESYVKGPERYYFVALKKLLALGLLAIFITLGVKAAYFAVAFREQYEFFATFYTFLVFGDILLVLLAQRYVPAFHFVFRNSGFAVSTLLIRLALASPPLIGGLLGLVSAIFAVGLTLAHNAFLKTRECEDDCEVG